MNTGRPSMHRQALRPHAARGWTTLRCALLTLGGAALLGVGIGVAAPTHASASGNTYTWKAQTSGYDLHWGNANSWTCSGGCSNPLNTQDPVHDPGSAVVLPPITGSLSSATILDASANITSLTLQGDYSISGSGTTLTATGMSAPSNTLTLSGSAPSGVTVVAPVAADSTNAHSVQGVIVASGNSFQTSTPSGCGPGGSSFCLQTLSLSGAGPSSSSLPGALVVSSGSLNVGSLTVAASTAIQTNGHPTDFGSLANDPAATLTTKGAGALEFGSAFDLHNLDFSIAAGGALNYVGTLNTVTLGAGASLGNKNLSSDIAARGTVTLAGDASVALVDDVSTTRILTLSGSLAANGHTLTVIGSGGGELLMDSANTTTGSIVVQSGATLRASGILHDLHLAGSGDAFTPPASPASALRLDGTLSVHALALDADAVVNLGSFSLTPSVLSDPLTAVTLTLHGSGLFAPDPTDSTARQHLSLAMPDRNGLKVVLQGSVHDVTVCPTCSSVVGSPALKLGAPAGTTLSIAGVLHLGDPQTDFGAFIWIASGNDITGAGGTVSVAAGGFDPHGSTILADGGLTLDQATSPNPRARIQVTSSPGGVLTATGSLSQVIITGNGPPGAAIPGALIVPAGLHDLSIANFDGALGNSTVNVAAGRTLTLSNVFQSVGGFIPTVTLTGSGGTTTLTNPQLPPQQGFRPALFEAANGAALATTCSTGTCHLDTTTLDAGSTLLNGGPQPVELAGLTLAKTGAPPVITGPGTTVILDALADGPLPLQVGTGGEDNGHGVIVGVTVVDDNLGTPSLANLGISVLTGSALQARGSIASTPGISIAGAGPGGSGAALVVDGTLSIANLAAASDATVKIDPGRTLNIATSLAANGHRVTLNGPGPFAGPSTVNLPSSVTFTGGALEVGGGVVVNGGAITLPELDLHGGARVQPSSLDFNGGTPLVLVQTLPSEGPAQIGSGSGTPATTVGIPGGTTLDLRMASAGAWVIIPAAIVDSGGPGSLTVDGSLGTAQLTANNTYTGGTSVATNTTLLVDGVQPQSDVTLLGGTLGGSGVVGAISGGTSGTVAPDLGSTLTATNPVHLTASGDTLRVSIAGTTSSQLDATLGAAVANPTSGPPTSQATLAVSTSGAAAPGGTSYDILASPTATGAFAGLPDGAEIVTVDSQRFTIHYNGGANHHDIVLVALGMAGTTTVVSADHNPQASGQPVLFTATVATADPNVTLPSGGTVSFFDGSSSLGQGTVTSGLATLSTSALSAGPHNITAQYAGDAGHLGSTSLVFVEHIQALTNTVLSASSNPVAQNQPFTLHATVTSPGAGTPTGSVHFLDGNTELPNSPVTLDSGGVATLSGVTLASVGAHSLTAVYAQGGSANDFAPSTSAPLTENVTGTPTLHLTSSPAPTPGHFVQASSQPVTLTVTVDTTQASVPTGNVTFLDGGAPITTVALTSGSAQITVSTLSIGAHQITASYTGDTLYSPATAGPITQHITAPTTTAASAPQTTVPQGSQVTLTVHVTSATPGTITGSTKCTDFYNGVSTDFGGSFSLDPNGFTTCTTPALSAGTHRLHATYLGDDNYTTSASPDVVVNTVSQAVALSTSAAPSTDGQPAHFAAPSSSPITFSALVTGPSAAPTGQVTFLDGGQSIGTGQLVSQSTPRTALATLTTSLQPGLHVITAQYPGDGANGAGTSNVIDEYSTVPTVSAFTISTDPIPSTNTESLLFSATVRTGSATPAPLPAGTVTWTDTTNGGSVVLGSAPLGTDGTASRRGITLPIGYRSITATYSGDNVYSPSTSPATVEHVTAPTTTTVSSSGTPALDATPVTLIATVLSTTAGTPGGTVRFFDGATDILDSTTPVGCGQAAGCATYSVQTSAMTPGVHHITATYVGDLSYTTSSSTVFDQDIQAHDSVVVSSAQNPAVTGTPVTLTATISPVGVTVPQGATGLVTFKDGTNSLGTATASAGVAHLDHTFTTIGDHALTAAYVGDTSYAPATSESFTQTLLTPTATLLSTSRNPANQNAPLTLTATVTSNGQGTPTGSVLFRDGGSPLGSVPIVGGVAQLTTSSLSSGSHTLTAAFTGTGIYGPSLSSSLTQTIVPPSQGYWLVASDGGIFPFGAAQGLGSTGAIRLNRPIVGMASTPGGGGYWLVASDGGVFPFGDAVGFGSTGGIHLNQPIVGMTSTPSGHGYWLVASDGGIFPFGDAVGLGSTGGIRLNQPIVGMAVTPDGGGYWLVASDGGIFPFGDASGFGSTGAVHLNRPIVAMAVTPDGGGYWLVASDGGIFPFGDAAGFGSTGATRLNQPIVGMAATPTGRGYWLVASDGGIFPFGDAVGLGSTGGSRLNQPIVQLGSPPKGFPALPG